MQNNQNRIIPIIAGFVMGIGGIAVAEPARALVAAVPFAPGVAIITYSILHLFTFFFLFVCIPIALIGLILRFFGFEKADGDQGWKWNVKEAFARFFRIILYHAGFFGGWIVFLTFVRSYPLRIAWSEGYTPTDVLEILKLLIRDEWLLFILFIILSAIIAPILLYFWRRFVRNIPAIRPSVWSFVRLALWNVIIFLAVAKLSQAVITGQHFLPF